MDNLLTENKFRTIQKTSFRYGESSGRTDPPEIQTKEFVRDFVHPPPEHSSSNDIETRFYIEARTKMAAARCRQTMQALPN